MMMADTPSNPASQGPYQLTLTKSEIAFLNATIELMLEDQGGRTESVTIAVDDPTAFGKALVKTFKKINKWVEKNGGWLAVAALAADRVFGLTAESTSITREQAQALERFRAAARRGVTLEELLELRDRLEGRSEEGKSKITGKRSYERAEGTNE
jgi:hypothetical protein